MTFNNLNQLFKHIETSTQDVMQNEVADAVRENISEAVGKTVYDTYSPVYYNRRMTHGGLADTENIESYSIENGIRVRNTATLDNGRNDYMLDDIIVNRGVLGYPYGRDFYGDAVNRLEDNGDVKTAMKKGLQKKGFKCE